MMFKKIIPTERVIEYAVNQSNAGISYHYGNYNELNNYLKVGKSFGQQKSFIKSGKKEWKQYPLIWFVKPAMAYSTNDELIYRIPNAKIIIAVNNPALSDLNTKREQTSFKIIEPIANRLIKYLFIAQYVKFEDNFGFDKIPNYSVGDKSASIDTWDAIILEGSISFDINCLDLVDSCINDELII